MTASRPLALAIPLTLLCTLACAWGQSGSSNAKQSVQSSHQGNANASESARGPRLSTSPTAASTSEATSAAASSRLSDADFVRHVSELRSQIQKKLSPAGSIRRGSRDSSGEFSIIIQKPFVVIGDEEQAVVQQRAEDTVKWAVDRLKQDFFTKDPNDILDIWLFKDKDSYEKHVRLLFGDTPTTPFGYYSPSHKALIMNIDTGGGTLVHEIVHPFMEANFPECPPWLNEGLGSLYEQCGDVNGHIHGFTNWRLPGLQRAIQQNRVPSFKTLMEMNASEFYGDTTALNYAQARYLCFYLQEKGVLVKFYQEFLAKQKEDASGFKSLQKVLALSDMDAFKTTWEKYVLGLRQGYRVTVEP